MQGFADGAWRIGDGAFLVAYVVLVVVSTAGVALLRRVVPERLSTMDGVVARLDGAPLEVAYLNAGRDLVVLAACAALRAVDALDVRADGALAARPVPLPDDLPRLSVRVHAAAGDGRHQRYLRAHRRIVDELDAVAARVGRLGLTPQAVPRWRRYAWLVALPVLALGVARLVAGTGTPEQALYLKLLMLVEIVGTVVLTILVAPRVRGGHGHRSAVLRRLRARHGDLAPGMRPSWRTYGPAGAALSVALYGHEAAAVADPDLAAHLPVRKDAVMRRAFRPKPATGYAAGTAAASGALFTSGLGGGCGGGDAGGHGCGGHGCGGGGCGGGGCGGCGG